MEKARKEADIMHEMYGMTWHVVRLKNGNYEAVHDYYVKNSNVDFKVVYSTGKNPYRWNRRKQIVHFLQSLWLRIWASTAGLLPTGKKRSSGQ